jgi:hypothetical protein
MKLTKHSELLMSFFLEKKCIKHVKQNSKTKHILKRLFKDISDADSFVKSKKLQKESIGESFYKLNITKIMNVSQIPKPKSFNPSSFPDEIRYHIDNTMLHNLSYTFSLFDREIKIHFILEDNDISPENQIELYNEYVEKVLTWLYITNEYASKKCSKTLIIYLYFTSLKKELPKSKISILNQNNVNTAFTYTCPVDSEIVIFRKEEWFKVLMHETFHNFALDFSHMNTDESTRSILSIFKVKSEVNLFEAYTEFWAEIMNAVFCSFYLAKDNSINYFDSGIEDKERKSFFGEFLINFDFFINFERTYKFFQMVKTLEFMGLTYENIISSDTTSVSLRETLYKEKSNVLSYYVITTVLMNNYQGFLSWCDKNNMSLLQFKNTTTNVKEFCKFIYKNYKTNSFLDSVECMQQFFILVKKKKNKNKVFDYVLKNMRMTISELG